MNPQGIAARRFSGPLPSPIGLPFRRSAFPGLTFQLIAFRIMSALERLTYTSSGGRTRTPIVWLTASRSTFELPRKNAHRSYGTYLFYATYFGAYFLRRICHMFVNTISAVRTVGFEPTFSGAQDRRISRLSHILTVRRIVRTKLSEQSGWLDLNQHAPASDAGGLPSYPTP